MLTRVFRPTRISKPINQTPPEADPSRSRLSYYCFKKSSPTRIFTPIRVSTPTRIFTLTRVLRTNKIQMAFIQVNYEKRIKLHYLPLELLWSCALSWCASNLEMGLAPMLAPVPTPCLTLTSWSLGSTSQIIQCLKWLLAKMIQSTNF